MRMNEMARIFTVHVSSDKEVATLTCKDIEQANTLALTAQDYLQFLKRHLIVYGIKQETIKRLTKTLNKVQFPVVVAKGTPARQGKDGKIHYHIELEQKVKVSEKEQINFRDLMRIPTVSKGEKLATLIPPTKGQDGIDVYGKTIPHQPGERKRIRQG